MIVYSLLLLAALVLGAPYWLLRMATSGRYRAGLAGRLGMVPKDLRAAVAGRDVVWIHAVSVGETMAATQLIRQLREALPGWVFAISTTTETGQRLAKERLAGAPVFYLPLDFRFAVGRYLRVVQPRMLALMESELWPRLIDECATRGIPIVVVNARVSDRSFPRYMRLRRLWRPFLERISQFLAQSHETAERLVRIGAPSERVSVMGNLKYDVRAGDASPMTKRVGSLLYQARLIVAGSTLAGEEEALLAAWPTIQKAVPDAALLIAPRHPDRFEEVSGLIRKSGYPFFRCSHLLLDTEPIFGGTILLLDTIGDLASMYGIGAAAFVGGSLVPKGGHNPLEPAQFAVPVVMGPSFENFREMVEGMRATDAIRIVAPERLSETLIALLRDNEDAKALGERGRAVFEAQAGATARTVQALMALLQERSAAVR
ncbi:MAG TPA: 3-deoxy-D-manno-octulosonic acid transferase [Edaphobacter sp.]|jgi:3-deoxy-D-manno-octulosonic-acid transferase|nr:3-deoxy-D-manno-octulosonic acid transferase [Edaphobacter sp.]